MPCGTLAEYVRNRRRSWDFRPSQFSSCPEEPWLRRSASGEIVRCLWCLHLADPPAVFVTPSSIIFFRGIGRSNFLTHIHHKKRTIAGSHFGFWVFPRDKPHPFPLLCGHGPILPWAFSPSRFSDVTRRARTGSTPYAPSVPGHRFRRHAALGLFVDVRKSVRLGVISPTTSLPSAALQRIKKPMPSDRRLRVPPFAPCMRFCTVHVHSRRMTIGLFSHPMPNCRRFP